MKLDPMAYKHSWISIALFALSWQVHAASIELQLTASASAVSIRSFDFAGTHYDQYAFYPSGLQNPTVLAQGDSVTATMTLDQSFTVPASATLTSFIFALFGSSFPAGDTSTSGTVVISNLGATVLSGSGISSTANQVSSGFIFSPPNNGAITFDRIVNAFSIETLPQQASANSSVFYFTTFSPSAPVPELPIQTLMAMGMAVVAGAYVRRFGRICKPTA